MEKREQRTESHACEMQRHSHNGEDRQKDSIASGEGFARCVHLREAERVGASPEQAMMPE